MDVSINPGPGIQGPFSSVITINSNAANSPVVVGASGVAPALAASKTAISVTNANVLSVPVSVTVTPASGTGVPTGTVVISVDGVVQPVATLASGTVTVTLTTGFTAGSHTFSVVYIGDRAYGSSTASTTATVAKGAITLVLPTPPPYSMSTTADNEVPYDSGFTTAYATNYLITVNGAANVVPTGTVSVMQGTSIQCGSGTSSSNPPAGSFPLGSGSNWAGVGFRKIHRTSEMKSRLLVSILLKGCTRLSRSCSAKRPSLRK